jgi:hypothetical protein
LGPGHRGCQRIKKMVSRAEGQTASSRPVVVGALGARCWEEIGRETWRGGSDEPLGKAFWDGALVVWWWWCKHCEISATKLAGGPDGLRMESEHATPSCWSSTAQEVNGKECPNDGDKTRSDEAVLYYCFVEEA